MTIANGVKVAASALAAGFHDAGADSVRVTVTLQPGAGEAQVDVSRWPTTTRALKTFRLRIARPSSDHRVLSDGMLQVPLEPAVGRPAAPRTTDDVQALWERTMAGQDPASRQAGWDALLSALAKAKEPGSPNGEERTVIPPTHLAVLAYPFERGRMALDALAGKGSPLALRPPARSPLQAADGRLTHVAALNDAMVASDAVPVGSGDRAAPFASAGRSRFKAAHVARAAMGHHGGLDPILGTVRRAHRAATPVACKPRPKVDDPAVLAQRRLAALNGAPALQRLFGLAFDFKADLRGLKLPEDGEFLLLAVEIAGDAGPMATTPLWTLSKLRRGTDGDPGYFGPATWAEFDFATHAQGDPTPAQPTSIEGMEVLDRPGSQGHPAYALATVDPELAIEGDLGTVRTKQGTASSTLRSGGLRLLDLDPDARVRSQTNLRSASQQRASAASTSSDDLVQDADDLHPLGRLDLGLDTAWGPAWRCAGRRIVEYRDPFPGKASADWVETELTRLLGPRNGDRRSELDSATVSASIITVTPDSKANATNLPKTLSPEQLADVKPRADADRRVADQADGTTVTIASATVAAWGGEPMGAPTVRSDCPTGEEFAISRTISLPSSETGEAGPLLAMPMRFGWPYRVGVRRVFPGGVCVSLADAAARYADGRGHVCLPALTVVQDPKLGPDGSVQRQGGRRLLRHERVEVPLLAMLDGDAADLYGRMPGQGAGQAIVRTDPSTELAMPRVARRILAAPNVPLHFATLHDAFRDARHEPGSKRKVPAGGPLDGRLRGGDGQPLRIDLEHRIVQPTRTTSSPECGCDPTSEAPDLLPEPVYPDPAASIMVLRLRSPLGPDAWLEEPIAIPIRGRWPDVSPVLVELRAGLPARATRINYKGTASLGGLVSKLSGGALTAHVVEAVLRPAEDLVLDAWCVPTIEQLAGWFDVVEAAGVLAAHDAGASTNADASCTDALSKLLHQPAGASAALPQACYSAGGLIGPSLGTLRSLAAMLHQTLLREPIPSLAGVQSLRLTHAVTVPQAAPALVAAGASRLALARRVFGGGNARAGDHGDAGETRLDFIGKVSTERWTEAMSEEAALSALFGGGFDVDLASTSSIALEVECADPSTDNLDDAKNRGRSPAARAKHDWSAVGGEADLLKVFGFKVSRTREVDLQRRKVTPLRIDGLPPPLNGAPGLQRLTLEGLQAISWNGQSDDPKVPDATRPALRTTLDGAFATTGARLLRITPVAIGRHANLMHPEGWKAKTTGRESFGAVRGRPVDLWLPSTKRPTPPIVNDVEVRLERKSYGSDVDGTHTVGDRQFTHIRVRLARPWYSSGEGERLGLVLWPPAIFFRDPPTEDDAGYKLPDEIDDPDLGPVGPFVTRWGIESSDAGGAKLSQLVPASAFSATEADPSSRVSVAFMPLPSNDAMSATKPDSAEANPTGGTGAAPAPCGEATPCDKGKADTAPATSGAASAPDFAAVALLTSEPRFDIGEELWFVDFELRAEHLYDPYLRLGLVRYQPHAREDAVPIEGEEPVRLRVSSPVTASARVLPSRAAEVTWRKGPQGLTNVYVTARVSRPLKDVAGAGPAVRVTLLARRRDAAPSPSQRVTAFDGEGGLCIWESWDRSVNGTVAQGSGETLFTCMFSLPGDVEDELWTHVAVVETFSRRPPGTYANEPVDDEHDKTLIESGHDFVATLELKPFGRSSPGATPPSKRPLRADRVKEIAT